MRRIGAVGCALGATLLACLVAPPSPPAAGVAADDDSRLYLVTLRGPGDRGGPGTEALRQQDAVLAAVGAGEPVHRWTAALNGFAVALDVEQADRLSGLPEVARVEPNEVRPLAGTASAPGVGAARRQRGGDGVVIGVVDTGLDPDSPLFAQRQPGAGGTRFAGACAAAEAWDVADCNGKVVGARWYVDGFGADAVRATAVLSPRDTDGHGTQMASIAAGNAGVPVRVGGERLGRFGGQAPEAQLAVYKACWSAPDPADDGCATADLVSAIDDATRDGVDVLSLSVGGPPAIDTVELALLGAAESGVVVTAAAGNRVGGPGTPGTAGHPAPWVTTVGGTSGDARRGRVVLPGGRRLAGAMLSRERVGPARVLLGADVGATGARPGDARVCAPGSLDAARVAGAVVVCQRGRVGRVDKSRAVALADGTAMVLVNRRREAVVADVHSVPTVHLEARTGRRLVRWVRSHAGARVRLEPRGAVARRPRVVAYSLPGAGRGGFVKPDVLAPATGLLGAVPPSTGSAWDVVSGTSVATAYTAGVAATLLGRGATAPEVRSALLTTAAPIRRSPVLTSGSGRVRAGDARRPGLAYLVAPGAYRAWYDGRRGTLNTASVLLTDGDRTARRRITNVTGRRLYFSSSARGFRRDVLVTPAAVRLGAGESATFRVRVSTRGRARLDDGYVVWRGATGTTTRIPVVVTR